MTKEFLVKQQQTHDIEANWNKAINFIPLKGEIIIYDPDENFSHSRFKIGDGETFVKDLNFVSPTLIEGSNISINETQSGTIISVPDANESTPGATIVYPAESCTTFTSDNGAATPAAMKKAVSTFGITKEEGGTFSNSATSQSQQPSLKWKEWGENKNTPYIGFAKDQSDGTFLLGSLTGSNYREGLAIGGGSGNLLWKGSKVLAASDVVTSVANGNSNPVTSNAVYWATKDSITGLSASDRAITYTRKNGETGTIVKANSVLAYGAKGDGTTDDTEAFQNALAENRVVYVPGGTYKLSNTLIIRENCCLELSQDTILQFTQTSGNCVEMRGSAVLRGNHAIISAPHTFVGNVISMDTSLDGEPHNSIPPYEKSCPQWKRQRFIYNVNIIKTNSSGYNRPLEDGKCYGTAIYMHCDGMSSISWMWAIVMSGIRIAGGFSYGIRAYNIDDPNKVPDNAWNHDMRIEAVIEACEIGVSLENCNGAHLDVTIQPNTTPGGVKYAKQGVRLSDSRYVDMMRSRIWDWHVARNDSEEYKHIALYGNCRGLLLDDFLVTEHPDIDIRDDIYTDTLSNFDFMTILQEPANKWFKSVNGAPYFSDGTTNKKLMLASEKITAEQAEFITPADGYYTEEPNFTNLAINNTDGIYLLSNGSTATIADNYTTTDFIAIDPTIMHTYRIGGTGIVWKDNYGYGRIAWYDANKNVIGQGMSWDKVGTSEYYPAWVEDDTVESAFITLTTQSAPSKAFYFRITAKGKGENLIVTIDEKQEYNLIWHGEPKRLDDSIKVKAENVIGNSSWTEEEINALIDAKLGGIENGAY